MSGFKEQYELSIWNDIVVNPKTVNEYFDEEKIGVIGSDTMDTPIRAYNVSLNENINGELTLTFDMLYNYMDETGGDLKPNPFLGLLVNERKIKLRVGAPYQFTDVQELSQEDTEEKWHTFVIKNSEKSSDGKNVKFTAKEIYVNELGKNGWSVVLDTGLENNYGTLPELAEKILEGSDWVVNRTGFSPTEKVNEPLFRARLLNPITVSRIMPQGNSGDSITIAAGEYIYPFYSSVEWSTNQWVFISGEKQFLYAGKIFTMADANDDRTIIDDSFSYNYYTSGTITPNGPIQLTGMETPTPGEPLNGNKVVRTQIYKFDSKVDHYVGEYIVTANDNVVGPGVKKNDKVYAYTETEYVTSDIVSNWISPNSDFTSNAGWTSTSALRIFPDPQAVGWDTVNKGCKNYLSLNFVNAGIPYQNTAPSTQNFEMIKDKVYVFRMKARWINKTAKNYPAINTNSATFSNLGIQMFGKNRAGDLTIVAGNTLTNGYPVNTTQDVNGGYAQNLAGGRAARPKYTGAGTTYRDEQGYTYLYLVSSRTTKISEESIIFQIGNVSASPTYDLCVEDIQFFEYKVDGDGIPVFPGDTPSVLIDDNKKYYYVDSTGAVRYLSINSSYYKPSYEDGYQSVRNIDVKESNYFNNLQTLAELFEVWVKFKVYHQKNGKILIANKLPKKEVIFSQYAPNQTYNYAGFKYGVNLSSITRTLNSDQISTKIIVQDNNQKYAKDGTCSITRAHDNPSGDNEIYEFSYYVNQGLLNYGQMLADLYGMSSDDFAYYRKMKALNNQYIPISDIMIAYENQILVTNADLVICETTISSAKKEETRLINLIDAYAGQDSNQLPYRHSLAQVQIKIASETNKQTILKSQLESYTNKLEATKVQRDALLKQKKALQLEFYKKYSRYIQEGTWNDDDYVDSDLYYLDALKIASISAFPSVEYSINVVDIQGAEGYEGYDFEIGQMTTLEDTEFFGWITKLGIKTPVKQEVIISERLRNFDDPSKSTLTIQNYKNQYEELFQQIQATTTSLQYSTGKYNRAASSITPNGEIDIMTLERSFMNNQLILSNSINQDVKWDTGRGIEVTDGSNQVYKVKIVGTGIFVTTDGNTWTTGITASGINTALLTAGVISTDKILIRSGEKNIFRWDQDGISAFYSQLDQYNVDRYVNFSQYGMYGTMNGGELKDLIDAETDFDKKLDVIQNNATFALTWEGLYLHGDNGSISLNPNWGLELFGPYSFTQAFLDGYAWKVNPEQQLYVDGDKIPLISLGKFYNTNDPTEPPHYGLRMRNVEGAVTFDTDNNGNLWIRDRIIIGNRDGITDDPFSLSGFNGTTISQENFNSYIKPILDQLKQNTQKDPTETDEDFLSDRSVRIWAGSDRDEIELAPFWVLNNGTFFANSGYLTGLIYAQGGRFDGLLSIGKTNQHGIDGTNYFNKNMPIFYAGEKNNPTFYLIDQTFLDSTLTLNDIATNMNISYDTLYKINKKLLEEPLKWNPSIIVNSDTLIKDLLSWDTLKMDQESPYYDPNWVSDGKFIQYSLALDLGDYLFYVDQYGSMYAKDANIEGNITVNTGSIKEILIPDGRAGISSDKNILLWINADNYEDSSTASFYVTKDGSVYASKMYLRDSLFIDPFTYNQGGVDITLYRAGININDQNQRLAFWAGAQEGNQDYTQSNFTVDYDGKIKANYLDLGAGALYAQDATLHGTLKILRDDTHGYVIDSNEGIYTTTYNTAQGWKIDSLGNAFFNNVSVRGELTAVTFSHDSKNVMGGDLLISPSYYDINGLGQIIIVDTMPIDYSTYKIIMPVPESIYNSPIWVNSSQGQVSFVIQSSDGVHSFDGLSGTLSIDTTNLVIQFNISKPDITWDNGSEILLNGTSITSIGVCGINLSASYNGGPSIIITSPNQTGEILYTQLGNLEGIVDIENGFGDLSGVGLYSQNAYLTGRLYTPQAGFTNEEIKAVGRTDDGGNIRIWAGTNPGNMSNAPFIVTQDGSLYAQKGVFKGTVEVTDSIFSGYIVTAGILIDDQIDDDSTSDIFYVAYDHRGSQDFPTVDDKIIQIDKKGISIWEGGLHAFSDYASGWRIIDDDAQKIDYIDRLYGYNGKFSKTKPYPYFSLIDSGFPYYDIDNMDYGNERAYMSELHVGKFLATSDTSNNSVIHSMKLIDGNIFFSQRNIPVDSSFEEAEFLAYNQGESKWKIGLQDNLFIISCEMIETGNDIEISQIRNSGIDQIQMMLKGLLKINGSEEITSTLKIGNNTVVKPYDNSISIEDDFGIDFMI